MNKNIAIMIYGQFRNYKKNLRNNINMLDPFLKLNTNSNTIIHVFLLTDKKKDGNYSPENENEIICIFKEFGFKIGFIKYIEDCDSDEDEDFVHEHFMNNVKHKKGIDNDFVPRLIYRKYLLNQLKNKYTTENNIHIDLNVYCRLFDMNISFNKNPLTIANEVNKIYDNPNILLGASDTFFIGTNATIDYLFSLSELYKTGKIYHDDIWDDMRFFIFYFNYDSCLALLRHTYSPEVQYMAHIFYSNYRYQHVRFDYNNPNSEYNLHMLYHIRHDPERFG
jgi:hypothetical protein